MKYFAFISGLVLLTSSMPAHAAGYWILTGSQPLNPASLGRKCFYRWSTDVRKTLVTTVGPYTLCPSSP
jgi:hypothetical protein